MGEMTLDGCLDKITCPTLLASENSTRAARSTRSTASLIS